MDLNYVGLEINQFSVLINEFVAHLPLNISSTIDGHLRNLQNSSAAGQIDVVKKLIACLRTKTPDSFDEYIGYVAFTAAIALIKNLQIAMDKCALVSLVFDSVCVDQWDQDLVKMSIIAQTIWKVCGSKSDNIRQIATNIGCKSNFMFVTSILLTSAAMNAIVTDDNQPKIDAPCMYELSKLLQMLCELNLIDDLSKKYNKLHQFLAIYSCYQSLVYLRKPTHDVHPLLKPYFTSSKHDLQAMQQFMRNLSVELNVLMRKSQQFDYLGATELIEFVILPDLEQLIKTTQ